MINIKYITHACLQIKLGKDYILTDPWLNGPCWGGNIWHYPKNNITFKDIPTPKYIFFSHGHDDHLHFPSIEKMPPIWKKKSTIIAPDFGAEWWTDELNKTGFKKFLFLKHNEKFRLNKFDLQIFINDRGDTDSSLLIKKNDKSIFLQTDNIMSEKEAKRISKISNIQLSFVMPFMTGAYPAFYRIKPINSDYLIKGANLKKETSLKYSTRITKILKSKYTVPYASDIAYMGENFFANVIMSHNKLDFLKKIKQKKVKTEVKLMCPNDTINIDNNFKFKFKTSKYEYNNQKLAKFYYDNLDEYDKVVDNEKKYTLPKIKDLTNIFKTKIIEHFKNNNPKINFIVQFKIKELKSHIINFMLTKNKIKKIQLKKIKKIDLSIEIESYRLRRMLKGDYPMHFLTFHNGGYHCTRRSLGLTANERKFWEWINFLNIS